MAIVLPEPELLSPTSGSKATSRPANADDRQLSADPTQTSGSGLPRIVPATGNDDTEGTELTSVPAEKDVGCPALLEWAADPANPLNWPSKRKWLVAMTVSVTGFLSTMGSSMAAPLGPQIGQHFGEESEKVQTLLTAFFVLGLGCGPFLFAPTAELYGRRSAYVSSTVPYALFNAACIIAPNMPALIILRFFAGVFASSGPALGIATVSDVFSPRERGTPISIYATGPMSGPVLGSMVGGWLSLVHWRWTFAVLAIISALNGVAIVLTMSETYAPAIRFKLAHAHQATLHPRGAEARRESKYGRWGWVVGIARERDWKAVFRKAFSRPFRFLLFNPVLAFAAIYYSMIYACIYLLIVTVPLLFEAERAPASPDGLFNYEWSPAIFPLCFLGLGFGFLSAATTAANLQNRIYAYLCTRNGDSGQPEYRLVLTQIGMLFFPIGWFIYGWSAQAQVHWMGPLSGLAIGGYGLMLAFNSIQNFVVDYTAPYSAAGSAGITFSRSILACLLPIYGPQMFRTLGWGWGGSLMAFVSLVAVPAPLLMWKYGRRLRAAYPIVG